MISEVEETTVNSNMANSSFVQEQCAALVTPTSSSSFCTRAAATSTTSKTTTVPITVLPGCGKSADCMVIEIEVMGFPSPSVDELDNKKSESQVPDMYCLDHATQAHLDACSSEDIQPFDETVTLPLTELRNRERKDGDNETKVDDGGKEQREEDKEKIVDAETVDESLETDSSKNKNGKHSDDDHQCAANEGATLDQPLSNDDDDETGVQSEKQSDEPPSSPPSPFPSPSVLAEAASSAPANLPTTRPPPPPPPQSKKPPPHQPCYLLRGDFRSLQNPGAIGVAVHPIHVAALCSNIKGLRKYAEKYGVDALREETEDKRSILEFAVRSRNVEVVKFLMEECKLPCHAVNVHHATPLMISVFAKGKSDEISKYLLENCSSDELQVNFDSAAQGENALQWAILAANWDMVEILITKHHATLSKKLNIPLFMQSLCLRGSVEGLSCVLDRCGARLDYDVTADETYSHPLIYPSLAKDEETAVKLFDVMKPHWLEHGPFKGTPAVTNPALVYDVTPLHYAARNGYVKMIDRLREIGLANTPEQINARSRLVGSPLMFALTPAGYRAVDRLLELGADANQSWAIGHLSRISYWDAKGFSCKGQDKERDEYLSQLRTGDEFHNILINFLKHQNVSPHGGILVSEEDRQRERRDILAHGRKYRRNDKFLIPSLLPLQGTMLDMPFTANNCSLPSGLALVDFGVDFGFPGEYSLSNPFVLFKYFNFNSSSSTSTSTAAKDGNSNATVLPPSCTMAGNTSPYALRLHELKAHWMRYYYHFFGGGGFYAADDCSATDLARRGNPSTINLACKIVVDNEQRLQIQDDEESRKLSMTREELHALQECRKKRAPLSEEFAARKKCQILRTLQLYRAQTTVIGQLMSCQTSLKNGAGGGLMMSADGMVQYLQDQISARIVGFVHRNSLWLRNRERW